MADWPQPSNIWTCMCGSFLQAPPLIISVLLVTFSFSHSSLSFSLCSNRINTLYLDIVVFHFGLYKSCLCSIQNKAKLLMPENVERLISICFLFQWVVVFVFFKDIGHVKHFLYTTSFPGLFVTILIRHRISFISQACCHRTLHLTAQTKPDKQVKGVDVL